MLADKLVRSDGKRFVSSSLQAAEMRILGDYKICLAGDRAIAEFVVIRIDGDDRETELWLDSANIIVKLGEQFKQGGDIAPTVRAGKPRRNLFVFEENLGGNREDEATVQQGAEDGIERLLASEYLDQDAGIHANRHA